MVKIFEIFTDRVSNGYNVLAKTALNEVYFHVTYKLQEVYKGVGTSTQVNTFSIFNRTDVLNRTGFLHYSTLLIFLYYYHLFF